MLAVVVVEEMTAVRLVQLVELVVAVMVDISLDRVRGGLEIQTQVEVGGVVAPLLQVLVCPPVPAVPALSFFVILKHRLPLMVSMFLQTQVNSEYLRASQKPILC
jgi:hypothetical protein